MIDPTPTTQQARVLRFILDFWFAHGFAPTVRAIADHFGYGSSEGAMCHLRPLVRKGHLRRLVTRAGGQRRTVYAPTAPELRAEPTARGVLVGSAGGPVPLSRERWVAWLKARLAEMEV